MTHVGEKFTFGAFAASAAFLAWRSASSVCFNSVMSRERRKSPDNLPMFIAQRHLGDKRPFFMPSGHLRCSSMPIKGSRCVEILVPARNAAAHPYRGKNQNRFYRFLEKDPELPYGWRGLCSPW